jgi:hypothetical protein
LYREALARRCGDDPVGEDAAALAAERGNQDRERAGRLPRIARQWLRIVLSLRFGGNRRIFPFDRLGRDCAFRTQPIDDAAPHLRDRAVQAIRIADDVGAIKRRAEHGGVRDFAAQAAADAALDDGRHRFFPQRIGIV